MMNTSNIQSINFSNLPCISFSAPGTSKAIISHDKLTKFNRRDQSMSMGTKDGIHEPEENSSTPRIG
jgi:hypothetical protein